MPVFAYTSVLTYFSACSNLWGLVSLPAHTVCAFVNLNYAPLITTLRSLYYLDDRQTKFLAIVDDKAWYVDRALSPPRLLGLNTL
jgi:hypothetical protein